MAELALLGNFLLALGLGALIGLEREYARYKKHTHDYAGIRTFPLISLFGALCAFFAETINPWILVAGIVLMGILIIVSYYILSRGNTLYHGATSEVAGLLAFFIGILSYLGEIQLAVVLAVIITIILYSRSALHSFAHHLKKEEMRSTLIFMVIAFVVLPFLPNKGYGPYELFNPFLFWLMVVFISGINFAGYILMKWLGGKGIQYTGLLGGLANSTAVTSSFAHQSNKNHGIYKALVLGVILANGMMFARILLEVFALNRDLFISLLLPMLLLIAVSGAISYYLWKRSKHISDKIQLESPFNLKPALQFAAIFAVVLAFLKVADAYLSSRGLYVVSFLSGLANVDAITLSLAHLANDTVTSISARNGIIIAAAANMALKGGLTLFLGEKKFGWLAAGLFLFLILISLALLLIPYG